MPDRDIELAGIFADLARSLVDESDEEATIARICAAAVHTIEPCQHAGTSLIRGRTIVPGPSSDEVPLTIDRIQSEVQEGPCIDAIREQEVFCTGDLRAEARWPHFARRAFDETGVRSVLSFRLFMNEDDMGALNLYSRERDAFDDDAVAFGSVFAAHAAVAMENARTSARLERRAQSRDVIGMAKGILMAQRSLTEADAFEALVEASQRTNTKLRELAETVAETGEIPREHPRP